MLSLFLLLKKKLCLKNPDSFTSRILFCMIYFSVTGYGFLSQAVLLLILFTFSQIQFVVGLGDKVSPTDIEEGMRVG